MKLIKTTAMVTLLSVLMSSAGCSSHTYYSEAQGYVKVLEQEMVRAGLPTQQKLFAEHGGWEIGPFRGGGIHVYAYEVTDATLANRLVERVRETHSLYPAVPVTVTVYSNAHIDNLHPGSEVIVARAAVR
jgi:hypothetical protein